MPAACRPPQVAASAAIPLRGLLSQRRLSGAWRLKEATAGVAEADRLDLGRATVQLAWWVQPRQGGGLQLLVARLQLRRGCCVRSLLACCIPSHARAFF